MVPGGSDRGLVLALVGQLVQELLVNWGEVEAVEDVAQGLLVHHVVVLQVLEQALLQGGALAEQAVDQDRGLRMDNRGVHISMGKFQSGFLKKHIIFPGCILFPESKYVRVEHFDPGK